MQRQKIVCLHDLEQYAREILPRDAWGYFSEGSCAGVTQLSNLESFKEFLIRPRVLRGTGRPSLSTTLLGQPVSMPVCIGPSALHGMAHASGELATAAAALQGDICYCMATVSTTPMQQVAASNGAGLRWYQIYVMDATREEILVRVRLAETLGFKALVLTVDAPIQGRRYADARNRLAVPPHLEVLIEGREKSRFERDPDSGQPRGALNSVGGHIGWDYVSWLVSVTHLPVVLKGIYRKEDALLAVQHGAKAVWVSNHGGRMLDTTESTLDLLREVVSALRGADSRTEVYVDGGVRYGTDVLKALCLGARAVFIGQPVLWGLACGGKEGVCLVLDILRQEFMLAMALSGCKDVRDIPESLVVRRSQYLSSKL